QRSHHRRCEQGHCDGRRARHEQQQSTGCFDRCCEVTEPLPDADQIEDVDPYRSLASGKLDQPEKQKREREDDPQGPGTDSDGHHAIRREQRRYVATMTAIVIQTAALITCGIAGFLRKVPAITIAAPKATAADPATR